MQAGDSPTDGERHLRVATTSVINDLDQQDAWRKRQAHRDGVWMRMTNRIIYSFAHRQYQMMPSGSGQLQIRQRLRDFGPEHQASKSHVLFGDVR